MDINVNFRFLDNTLIEELLSEVIHIGTQMASIQEVIDAVSAQQAVISADLSAVGTLLAEVRQLLSVGSVVEADALLATIQANTDALTASVAAIGEATAAVDAVNGDAQIPA